LQKLIFYVAKLHWELLFGTLFVEDYRLYMELFAPVTQVRPTPCHTLEKLSEIAKNTENCADLFQLRMSSKDGCIHEHLL